MKKVLTTLFACFLMASVGFGQAIKDRNVIPVAVNLNQVLRMTVNSGGNIEFTFNNIDQYKTGIDGTGNSYYQTNFTIASSTRWNLAYGAEDATFLGTDDPTNTLPLDNVGFTLTSNGTHALGTEIVSTPTTDGTIVAPLTTFAAANYLIEDGGAATASAGDETDNDFTLDWRAGTNEGAMAAPLIDLATSPAPDRYVTNVIFELQVD